MLLGNDLDNFHNFFHQLLVLWIIHVVLSLMSQLVHIFSLTMLSFVSTSSLTVFRLSRSSAIAIRMLLVFCFSYPSTTLVHHRLQNCASSVKHIHHCLLLHYAVSCLNRPIIDSLRNSPTHSQTHSIRLPGPFVSRITLSLDT